MNMVNRYDETYEHVYINVSETRKNDQWIWLDLPSAGYVPFSKQQWHHTTTEPPPVTAGSVSSQFAPLAAAITRSVACALYSLSALHHLRHYQLIPAQLRAIHRAELSPPIEELLKATQTKSMPTRRQHSIDNRIKADPTLRHLYLRS